nr:MAG TPA: hypothetical protein [Caudoviricetes sp.]
MSTKKEYHACPIRVKKNPMGLGKKNPSTAR